MKPRRTASRDLWIGVLGLLAPFGVACSSTAEADCAHPQTTTTVAISDFTYRPGCLGVSQGATLSVTDHDSVPHTFTIQGTSVGVALDAGQTTTVPVTGLAPGTYRVICRYHPQMVEGPKIG